MPCSVWILPGRGIEPVSPHWQATSYLLHCQRGRNKSNDKDTNLKEVVNKPWRTNAHMMNIDNNIVL